ncbi:MAG TPA: hypothetical protein VF230_15250 [Acidimicrobiales bacterium]
MASPIVISPFADLNTGLSGSCTIVGGVATTTYVDYAVDGTATATGGVALSTGVTCTVKTSYGTWGGASGGLPGAVAVAAGTVRIPVWALSGLRVCASANTLYHPNTPRSYTQPNC